MVPEVRFLIEISKLQEKLRPKGHFVHENIFLLQPDSQSGEFLRWTVSALSSEYRQHVVEECLSLSLPLPKSKQISRIYCWDM